MQYIAGDTGSVYHACESRERVVKNNVWKWTGQTLCHKTITGGISGHSVISMIDCKSCQKALRAEGYEL